MNTPEAPDDANTTESATNRAGGPKGKSPKPSFSQFGHWVWLNQTLSDAGHRYYTAVRSYIFDADEEFEVDLTDEVIAELLGKSAKSVGRARRDCYKAGVIEELATWKESVRVEGKAKPEVRAFRRLIVHHEVPEGYDGPVNAYAEKRRIEKRRYQEQKDARDERERLRQAARDAREQGTETPTPTTGPETEPSTSGSGETNLSGQSDQGIPDGSSDSPAQCGRTDLSGSRTKLSAPGTNLSASAGDDQGKRVPHLPSHLPSHQPTNTGNDMSTGAEHAVNDTTGWLDTVTEDNRDAGHTLLRSLPVGVGTAMNSSVAAQWAPVVGAALQTGTPADEVRRRLTGELPDGDVRRRVRIVVGSRLPELCESVRQRVSTTITQQGTTDVHTTIDKWAKRGLAGAQQAASLLGVAFDPEQRRNGESAQDWVLTVRHQVAREFIEENRTELAAALERSPN